MSVPAFAYVSEEGEDRDRVDPASPAAPSLRAVGGTRGAGSERASAPSVLLVEDDDAMQLLCTVNLELAGFRVVTASTGTEGLSQSVAQGPFDLVLLDVMLPDLGGYEVAERLLAAEATRDVPIVFVSARVSPDDVARGRAVGAIDYIGKPFDPVALAGRLHDDLDLLRRGGTESVRARRFGPANDEGDAP